MKKTQKSFRKKALLSSLSMLMVATVAVGSATFAWFTSSTTATASGIKVKTTQASKLQISKKDQAWGTTITYTNDEILQPVSTSNFSMWKTTSAASSDEFTATTPLALTSGDNVAGGNQYYIAEMLNIKNSAATGGANVKNISVTVKMPSTGTEYMRFALVPVAKPTTDGDLGTLADSSLGSGKAFTDYIFGIDNEAYKPVNTTGDSFVTSDIRATPVTTTGTDIASNIDLNGVVLKPGEAKYYNLYVWFEGQDPDCKDENAGKVANGLSISVSGQTEQPTT